MSEIDWTAIRNEYEAGASLRALAAKHGVSKSLIGKRKFQEKWTEKRIVARGQQRVNRTQAGISEVSTPQKNELSTKDRQRLFLEEFAKHANVMLAAKAAGIHRSTVYVWLENDEDFSFAYNQAKEDAKDVLRAEIYRRAKEGWDEPVYQMGYYAGNVRKYSDTLLIFHSKALMPEYREKSTVDVNANVTGTIGHVRKLHALTDDELEALERLAEKAKGEHGN